MGMASPNGQQFYIYGSGSDPFPEAILEQHEPITTTTTTGAGTGTGAGITTTYTTGLTTNPNGLLRISRKPIPSSSSSFSFSSSSSSSINTSTTRPPSGSSSSITNTTQRGGIPPRPQTDDRASNTDRHGRPSSTTNNIPLPPSIAEYYSPIPEPSPFELHHNHSFFTNSQPISVPDGFHRVVDATTPAPAPAPSNSSSNLMTTSKFIISACSNDDDVRQRRRDDGMAKENGGGWRPAWLTRKRLWGYASVLSVCMVGVLLLLVFCEQNSGLVTVEEKYAFLWKSGPISVVVILIVIWARIDYQALRYMPWIAAHNKQTEIDDELDYVSMFFAPALFMAFARRHWLVFFVIITTIFLNIQAILSTSLLTIKPIPHETPTTITIEDVLIVPQPDLIATEGVKFQAYSDMLGIRDFGLQYPFGTTDSYVHQKFTNSDNDGNDENDDSNDNATGIRTLLDGITVDLSCTQIGMSSITFYQEEDADLDGEEAIIYKVQVDLPEEYDYTKIYNTTFARSVDRGGEAKNFAAHQFLKHYVDVADWPYYDGPRLLVIQLGFSWSTDAGTFPDITSIKTLMCRHAEILVPLQVVKRSNNVTATPVLTGKNHTLLIDMEELFLYAIPQTVGEYFSPSSSVTSTNAIPGPIAAAELLLNGQDTNTNRSLVGQTLSQWEESLGQLYRKFGALVLSERARHVNQEFPGTVTGILQLQRPHHRLIVDYNIAYLVAAIFGTTALIVIVIALFLAPVDSIAPICPDTILGMAVIATEKSRPKSLAESVPGGSSTHSADALFVNDPTSGTYYSPVYRVDRTRVDKAENSNKKWSPLILSTPLRVVMVVLMYGLGGGLVAILQVSQANKGYLAEVPLLNNTYLRYTWTIAPTLVLFLLATYIVAVNNTIRRFAPLSLLAQKQCDTKLLSTSFIDCLSPKGFTAALGHGAVNVALSELAAFLALLMLVLSGALLSIKTVPIDTTIQLQQTSWFAAARTVLNYTQAKSTGVFLSPGDRPQLGANGSLYPAHTYENLAFDSFTLPNTTSIGPDSKITATVSAIRLVHACPEAEIDFPVLDADGMILLSSLTRNIDNTGCEGEASSFGIKPFDNGTSAYSRYINQFARAMSFDDCAKSWYYFGDFWPDGTLEKGTSNVSILLECSYVWEKVEVKATFLGPKLEIDHSHPPQVVEESAVRMNPQLPLPQWKSAGIFPDIFRSFLDPVDEPTQQSYTLMDPEFRWLVTSHGGGPFREYDIDNYIATRNGNTLDFETELVAALGKNRAFLAAQIASANNRLGVAEKSTDSNLQLDPTGLGRRSGTMKDAGTAKLVASPAVAYVLLAITALLIAINIWALIATASRRLGARRGGWVVDMDMVGLVKENPGSFKAIEMLIEEGNLREWIPSGTKGLLRGEINQALFGKTLRLGWFWDGVRRKKVFALAVTETGDGELVFVGDRVLGRGKK